MSGLIWQSLGWMCLPILALPIIVLILPKPNFFNRLAYELTAIIDRVNYGLGEIVKWALLLLIVSTVASVIALSIFGLSFTKLDELPVYLHAGVIMLGSAVTLMAGQHVRVDIFYSRFTAKRKARLEILSFYALIIPVCILLIWVSQNFVAGAWQTLEGSNDANGIRGVFLLKSLVSVFAITVLAQALSIALRAALRLTGQDRPPRPANIAPLFSGPEHGSGL